MENDILSSEQDLLKGVSGFFKSLYSEDSGPLCDCDWSKLGFSKPWDKASLISPVTMEELKRVVFALKGDGAPGPDGFPNFFFQRF